MDPIVTFIIVLAIGIVEVTSALVGIAGAFVGFHIAALIFLSGGPVVLLIGAVVGAAVVLWGWRAIRL